MTARSLKNILVVEDEPPLVAAISSRLTKHGFQVSTARSVEQALTHLGGPTPIDAVWLDHYLVGPKTGLDLVTEMKGSSAWNNIPVFVVSNTASAEKVRSYLRLGAVKYYVKAENRLDAIIPDITAFLASV